MHAEILSWSRTQGIFAGLALEGATLRQDLDDNATMYGKRIENKVIVNSKMRAPREAIKLMGMLNKQSVMEKKPVSQAKP
jgi:lipid-binding SYLF domain-containing protein